MGRKAGGRRATRARALSRAAKDMSMYRWIANHEDLERRILLGISGRSSFNLDAAIWGLLLLTKQVSH